jgi:signal transduction histidine kinase
MSMHDHSPARILIVEDEQIVAKDLQQSLIDMGYDAFAIAASAEEAVAHASDKSPDVVLMDVRIQGDIDGIQTAAILKSRLPLSVIYLTAHADEVMIDRAKRTEPHGYLLKPVKAAELRSMIEITLHRRKLERELTKSHEQIRNMAQRLEIVREEERRAVAVLLHDGIAQDLFAMKLSLSQLESLAEKSPNIRSLCGEISLAVTKCMDATRQIANELRPAALAYSSVSSVIAEHARYFAERSSLKVSIKETDRALQLDEPTQLLLFRAAQEALTNVAKHAQATTVDIALWTAEGRITLEIIDNGIGITDDAMQKPRSLGLLCLRERFAAQGGGLAVRREEPTGTRVTVYLPSTLDRASYAA